MKNNIVTTNNMQLFTGVLLLFLISTGSLYGQFGGGGGGGSIGISGATVATVGQTKSYSITGNSGLTNTTWTVSSGTQLLSSSTYNASVKFNSAGTASLNAVAADSFFGLYDATIYVTVSSNPPSAPANPTLSSTGCGTGTLSRSGSPPTGVTWYWQGKNSTGTATNLGSGSTFTADQGSGIYYIRARNSSGLWSSGTGSVYATIRNLNPGTINGSQTVCYNGNPGTLSSTGNARYGNGYGYQWQYSTNGSSGWTNIPGQTATSYNPPGGLTTSRWYRRRVVSCSTTKYTTSIKVTVTPQVAVPATPAIANNCENTVLTRTSPPNGITWYWQSSASGTSTSNASASITRTSGSVYYLRGRNGNGCWGAARTINYGITPPPTYYRDSDGDGYGTGATTTTSCNGAPTGYVSNNADCNDGDTDINPTTVWYADSDGDSWGDNNLLQSVTQCTRPTGYVGRNGDINDSNALITNISPQTFYRDLDGDSFGDANVGTHRSVRPSGFVTDNTDCNDNNANIGTILWYRDNDGDGYGGNGAAISSCSEPFFTHSLINYVSNSDDYDDTTVNITNIAPRTFYQDNDGDGYGDPSVNVYYSVQPVGYVTNNSDCNDNSASINPNTIWFADNDGDGFGNASATTTSCTEPNGYVANDDDYNDTTVNITNIAPQTFYRDSDGDGYGDPSVSLYYSVQPVGYVTNNSDCNDNSASINPNTTWFADNDGDGYGNASATTNSCTEPNGYVGNGDDYDDSTVNITNIAPRTFYGDSDGDGFGDPTISVLYSVQPSEYVINNTDQCPQEPGANNGCEYIASVLSDKNYVYTRTYQVALTSAGQIQRNSDVIEQVAYIDGLGRPVQAVAIKQAPNKSDLITHLEYDAYGRQTKAYLPFMATGTVGSHRTGDQGAAAKAYYKNHYGSDFPTMTSATANAYSETRLEASPLNRPLKQAAPGEAWKMGGGHEIGFAYRSNTANEVRYYDVGFANNNTETPELITNGHYTIGELYKTITYDENHNSGKDHSTEEFTNKQGQVVLKRTYDNETPHDTYYVYDDFGNLSFVIPPKVDTSNGVSTTALSELCYQYKYDYRNRLIEKKIPGKGWEYIVYNKLDRPILTQDPNLEAQDKWLFTKYDAFGRVAYTGMINNNSSRATVQTAADAVNEQFVAKVNDINTPVVIAGTNVYYTNVAYPTVGITEVHSINYYDNDTFDKDGLSVPAATSFGETIISATKSLATGGKVRVLGTNNWITTLTGYDSKARPIYIISKNQELGTTDIVETKLDFVGKVLETKTAHTKGSNTPIVVTEKYTYDHAARLLTQTHQVGSSPEELIVSNTYDELGQLVEKGIGGLASSTNRLQSIDYSYNVRGWLKTINDVDNIGNDLFSFKLSYNDPTSGTALYNGNISQTSWKTANTDSSLKNYTYTYDALNRIKSGIDNTANYNLQSIAYDKNGNILSLNRKGHTNSTATTFGTMDNLVYSYDNGNKLTKVVDNGNDIYGFKDGTNTNDDFEYDDNGNLTIDRNKGITSITYNHLNLPTNVVMTDGNIQYIYDAAGIKIKKIVNNTSESSLTTTEYAGNYIYENDNLQFFNIAEGYVELVTSSGVETYDYIYQYKDHLGNVRLSYSDTDENHININDDFNENTGNWSVPSTGSLSNTNQKLNVAISSRWISTSKYITVTPGVPVHIEFDFEKGSMEYPVFFVQERINGVWESGSDRDVIYNVPDGHHVLEMTPTGDYMWIYFEKGNATDDGILTDFFVDNFIVTQGNLQIREENNYYPFGLRHKGYNNVVSPNSNSIASKFKYNGVELEESLGLNLYEMDVRSYDPAIARFTSIDPIVHFDYSTYTAFDNNPVYWADPSGADAESKSTEDLINDAWNQTPENGSATFDNQGSCNCGCPGKPPCEANTSPPDFKKAKSTGEFYAMAYSMNGHQAFAASNGLNGLTAFQVMEYDDAMDQFGAEVITWVAGGIVFKLVVKGGKVLYAAYAANKALKGAKFVVNANKFNYFFGRVVSGNAHNIARSAQNLKDLTTLGIQSERQLMRVFAKAFANGSKVSTRTTDFGTIVTKSINIAKKGKVEVSFFYKGGNMSSAPSVTTIIPKIFK